MSNYAYSLARGLDAPAVPSFKGEMPQGAKLTLLYPCSSETAQHVPLELGSLQEAIPGLGVHSLMCSQCPLLNISDSKHLFAVVLSCAHHPEAALGCFNASIARMFPEILKPAITAPLGNAIVVKMKIPASFAGATREVLHTLPIVNVLPSDIKGIHPKVVAMLFQAQGQDAVKFLEIVNSKDLEWRDEFGPASSSSASPSARLTYESNSDTPSANLALSVNQVIAILSSSTPMVFMRSQSTFTLSFHWGMSSNMRHTSAYDFYRALEYQTSGRAARPPDRYRPFLRMSRQFRHLLLLKRRGRAHTTAPIVATGPGELAIRCPACPRPGVNLPDNWNLASPQDQCLYIMFIAIDACFRLKRRLVGSDLRDPGLGTGWAYLVEWEPYRQYLLTVTDQKEISTCTGLAALDHANTKYASGYSATGVGAGVCARHEFVLPTGVADLQRGERYANMDYILASLLRHIDPLLRKIFSYDIACQWGKHLKERLLQLPPLVRLHLVLDLCRFVVPKMHLNAHIVLCRLLFSLGLILGSGQTDGEGIERLWAAIAGVAGSTKLSGHGARADQLDDHWSFWNWTKLVGLPKLLRRRLDNAQAELAKQEASFRLFSAQQAEHVPAWLEMVRAFEADESKPNPYALAEKEAVNEAEVRNELEEDDRKAVENGMAPLHAVSPPEFIAFGMELEEQQRHLQVQVHLKRSSQSTGVSIRLKPLRKKLAKGIRRLRELQATYTPPALVRFQKLVLPADIYPENIPLLLPSALLPAEQSGSRVGLVDIERRLRHAQCKAALARLRHQLHVKARLLIYKKHQSRNQGMNTRSRVLVARNESKIKAHSDTYQAARAALANIEPSMVWPPLLASDIRWLEDGDDISKREQRNRRQLALRLQRQTELLEEGFLSPEDLACAQTEDAGDDDDEDELAGSKKTSSGESKRSISWIWTMTGTTGADATLEDSLRVEWSKAYARVRQWREEVRILQEEWRRYPLSLAHEEKGERLLEGRIAYAAKQAELYSDLIRRADITWNEKRKGKGSQKTKQTPGLLPIAPVAIEDLMEVDEEVHPDVAEEGRNSNDESDDDDEESVAADDSDEEDDE
ncbi:hypothetical protein MKEN_00660500 [Mycena kentingensis (nom. inval.)]|nr:hypothetical protein MKEN_00660500 [Mycena kentingensis (nom. inval.)]